MAGTFQHTYVIVTLLKIFYPDHRAHRVHRICSEYVFSVSVCHTLPLPYMS